MSPKLRALSGKEVLIILRHFGFEPIGQAGSHVKLRRRSPGGEKQTLTIITHRELDKGTLHAIFRQACRFIPEQELRPHFFTD